MLFSSHRRGFSLIELLVVVGIICIVLALLLPAAMKVRKSAARLRCQNNMKQTGIALIGYHDANGSFPPAIADGETEKYRYISWMGRILPYIEQDNLWAVTDAMAGQEGQAYPWNNANYPALATPMDIFNCTSDPRGPQAREVWPGLTIAFTGYLGVSGTTSNASDGVLYQDSQVRLTDITDGASNTAMVGERPPSVDLLFGWWFAGWGQDGSGSCDVVLGSRDPYVPNCFRTPSINGVTCTPGATYPFGPGTLDDPCAQFHYWSFHDGGTNFLMADGSVHFVNYGRGPDVMDAMATRAGGEPGLGF